MRRILLAIAVVLVVPADAAEIAFLSPLDGSQVIGPQTIEVTTTATNVDRVEFYVDGTLAGVARTAPYRIAFDFGTDLEARTIVARVLSNGYRTTEQAGVTTAALTAGESITVDLVEVPLRIRSSKRVTAADIGVRENSVRQTIREITPQRGAAHFAFVVDRSLSMAEGRLEAALRAVDVAVDMLRPGDTASLVLFNHTVSRPRAIDSLHPVAESAMQLVASGGTSLRDAVSSVPARGRTYAIVITDGGDRNSAISEEGALRKVSGTKTVVAAVVLGTRSSFLEKAARNTGGTIKSATRLSVGRAVSEILADINSRYTLVYQSAGTAPGWRAIDVAPLRRGVEISDSRRGYFAE